MKAKPAVWLPMGALITALAGGGIYGVSLVLAKRETSAVQREIQAQTGILEQRRRELQALTAQHATLRENGDQMEGLKAVIAGLEAENAELQKKTGEQKNAWQAARDSFAADIETVRKSLGEKPVARVTLKNGDVLKQVRFKAMQGSVAVLEHADGIAKVQAEVLPEDLKTKLAADWNPALPADLEDPKKLMEMAAAAEAKAAEEAAQPGVTAAKAAQQVNVAAYLELENKIKALDEKIEQAIATRKHQRTIYEEAMEKHRAARSAGRASNHPETANAALDRADRMAGQIAEAQTQLRKMKEELAKMQLPSQQPLQ